MAEPASEILALGTLALRDRLASGALSAVDVARACIAAIEAKEHVVQAWAWFDPEHALREAEALDRARAAGEPIGPLHGLPVGLKDVIDVAGIPTENGTALDAGRVPQQDSWVAARLKQAGALLLGKTVTAELAYMAPGPTRNPHNPAHTPGGSSSGSAAAVAAGMAPLAVGTQTGGSVLRPASFCGVVGFKPSFGAIPRTGVLETSPTLDTIGVFGRTVEDAALLAEALFGWDAADPATAPRPVPRLLAAAQSEPPVRPRLAFVRQPVWDMADAETKAAFLDLAKALSDVCDEVELPAPFAEAMPMRNIVNRAEMAKCLESYEARGRAQLSPQLLAALDEGKRILARDYLAGLAHRRTLNAALQPLFDRYDALLTPASPGPAPEGLASTGSSAFNAIWTYCGTPAISLPRLTARNGLPMGVQLVGRRGEDARLLRTARWLTRRLAAG